MALRLEDKYIVHAKELGKGAWSVVRPCDVTPPYQPAALCAQPLSFDGSDGTGPSPNNNAANATASQLAIDANNNNTLAFWGLRLPAGSSPSRSSSKWQCTGPDPQRLDRSINGRGPDQA